MYELIKKLAANESMSIGEKLIACLGVTLLAMAIVFCVLVILMFVIKGLKIISDDKKTRPSAAVPAPAPAVPAPAAVENSSQTDESEVIAAVMAAVNCMSSGEGSKIIIRNIVKKNESWASAGLLEQMNSRL
ncbi:MAG: OadG family protein [Peptostreptococcaceae bacterium]|nr:OadG family protein [Peptostreptococcaceae bacterium]